MSNDGAIGFGGFLLGLGGGYLVLREMNLAVNSLAWIMIIIGATIILSALIRYASPNLGVHRVVSGLAGGLVFALFLTQGFSIFSGMINTGNTYFPYSTTEVKTYSGASPTDSIYLRLGSINGQVTVSTWDKNDYYIEATIVARGTTQAEADSNLAALNKELTRDETTAQQKLTLVYTSSLINSPYQISVDVKLPATAKLDLELTTSNGAITIENVDGGTVIAHTSNAKLELVNVKADTIRASTSNAQIEGELNAPVCELSTSNAEINLQIRSDTSGTYTLTTSNAEVDVTVASTASYRLSAATSNGEVTFNIPNLTYTSNTKTSKTATTTGYDTAETKISVTIQTSNADVTVQRNVAGI
jgi:DUF4097 and DUF4098 domain-containing protein YvlB